MNPLSRRQFFGDVAITGLLLLISAYAFVEAAQWPFRASLFPRLVSGLALCFSALKLISLLWIARRRGVAAAEPPTQETESQGAEYDEDDEQDLYAVFASAGSKAWLPALGWLALFFGGLWTLGLFAIVPLFTILYLRVVARASAVLCASYAILATALLYFSFERLLHLPVPSGMFF